MKYFLALGFLLLLGCGEVLENPQPADISGSWEMLGAYHVVSYGRIEMNATGQGRLVLINTEGEIVNATLSDFVSSEESFTLELISPDEDEPEMWEGTLSENQLCFQELKTNAFFDNVFVCFSRTSAIDSYRELVASQL